MIRTFVRLHWIFMNKDTTGTIDCCNNQLKESLLLACQFYYTYESCLFMGEVKANLNRGAIVLTIFTYCSWYSQVVKDSVSFIVIIFTRSHHQFCQERTLINTPAD